MIGYTQLDVQRQCDKLTENDSDAPCEVCGHWRKLNEYNLCRPCEKDEAGLAVADAD